MVPTSNDVQGFWPPHMACHGNADTHCCVVNGKTCDHIEENTVPGRRWACGLLRKYGTWAAMSASPEYEPIGRHWQSTGHDFTYCETFEAAFCCRPEYRFGRDNDKQPLPWPFLVGD